MTSMSTRTPSSQPTHASRRRRVRWRTASRRAGGNSDTSPSTSGSGRTAMKNAVSSMNVSAPSTPTTLSPIEVIGSISVSGSST